MKRACSLLLLAIAMMTTAFVSGCEVKPKESQTAYRTAIKDAQWVACAWKGQFVEEWADVKGDETTYYRRYLVYASAQSLTEEERTSGGLYISVPFAKKSGEGTLEFFKQVPDIAGLSSPGFQEPLRERLSGHSGWALESRILFLKRMEGRMDFTLADGLSVMDVMTSSTLYTDSGPERLCVPSFGEKAGELGVVSWQELSAWIPLYYWRTMAPHDEAQQKPVLDVQTWLDGQELLVQGRFVRREGLAERSGTRDIIYTFEVEQVLKGTLEEEANTITVRLPYSSYRANFDYHEVFLNVSEPVEGARAILSLLPKASGEAGYALQSSAGQPRMLTIIGESAVFAQWETDDWFRTSSTGQIQVSPPSVSLADLLDMLK